MIFLDSAATTLQKPPEVGQAMLLASRRAASPGRGSYAAAHRAAALSYRCRELAGQLFGVENPERVVLTTSATHGLNLAIRSLVKPGSTVVLSGYEHNAVTRTLHGLENVTLRVAEGRLFCPEELLASYRRLLPGADAAICCHVSNVFGNILPLEEVAQLCRQQGVPLIVDAAQSAGTIPIDFDRLGAAYLAMPGHKGLYGPQGTGLLLCAEGMQPEPLLFGGTGSNSLEQQMPDFLPDRLEAGTHNIPGCAGLCAGLRFVQRQTPQAILRHEQRLRLRTADLLRRIPGVELFEAEDPANQAGVLSFRCRDRGAEEIGEALGQRGIAVRAGYHCAPFAHRSAGTLETGTVRVSFSAFNQPWEVKNFAQTLGSIL